jgi:threonine/homoserine/homoserine lactone efflux protein
MLGPTIASLLPAAVAVALSPIPIVAIVVVLGTRRGRVNGVVFALGWIIGLTAVSALVVGLLGGADRADSGPATAASLVQAVLGLLLLVLAARKWRSRPRGDAEPEMPAWMDTVEHLQPLRALALGLGLSGLNPKNLALTAAAAASIAQAGLDGTDTVLAVAVFVAVGSITVAGAVAATLVAPRATQGPLASIKSFMSRHNAVIMMVILLIFGVKLLAEGVAALLS